MKYVIYGGNEAISLENEVQILAVSDETYNDIFFDGRRAEYAIEDEERMPRHTLVCTLIADTSEIGSTPTLTIEAFGNINVNTIINHVKQEHAPSTL